MTGNPFGAAVAKGEVFPFMLRGAALRWVTIEQNERLIKLPPSPSHNAQTKDPQGKRPGYLLQYDPRSVLLHNSIIKCGFFFRHSRQLGTPSKQFGTAHTTARRKRGEHLSAGTTSKQELRQTLIPDHSGYVGAPPQILSPSAHGIPQDKIPHRMAGASPTKA
ncbi:hypothetical protein CRG98_008695 [Punica granatum]|uniref:Uncharacterized protein n=1 Tax=Punica granatum TaxID=22663 RepID=A0A2I0KRH0_PUNGR|nr:hypothetical protein CRG98_008695 [Punica granatum]